MNQLELVAPVRVPPQGTQCYRLLQAMRNGIRLTIWNAMNDYGCGALHQRVKDLRDLGWPVRDEMRGKVKEFWLE